MVLQPILRTPDSSNRRSLRSNTPVVTFDLSPESSDSEQQVYFNNESASEDSDTTEEEIAPATQEEEDDVADSELASQEMEPCPICNLQFHTKHAMQNHVRRQHANVTAHTWHTQHAQWLLDNRLTTCTHCARPFARACVSEHARSCTSRDRNATDDEQLSVRTPAAAQSVIAASSSSAGSSSSRQPATTGVITSRTVQGVASILPALAPEPDFRSYDL